MTQYIELYNEILPLLQKQSHPVLNAQREETMALFAQQGFPDKSVERYRYTDVAASFAPNYGLSLAPLTIKDVPYVYAIKDAPIDVSPYYNKVNRPNPSLPLREEVDSLTLLNTALAHDAVVIYVPKGEKAKQPIRIENTLNGEQDTMVVRRVLIIMEELAEATIFFVDHANGGSSYLTSQVIEVVAKDGAQLDMYEMEETTEKCHRYSNLYIQVGRNANIRHNGVTLSNGVTRNGIDVYLQGECSEVTLNGAVIADRKQHVDVNTLIDHQVPQCVSNELYKYVADDQAVGAFAGRILVREGAQQTISHETNNNMCASEEARIYTQPMLEIYADDVKCAHGSTVGVMDEAALFYMQQRGIPLEEARTLLKNAFISQVIDEMKWESFRDRLHILVDKRLSKEERCGSCKICK
ncbi:MAG: Fe-S cluster assembly protein SufD [Prevotella sp.]|nr:Fe-S cluster assembly protein SufD [Candidatus Prevotella equi]